MDHSKSKPSSITATSEDVTTVLNAEVTFDMILEAVPAVQCRLYR